MTGKARTPSDAGAWTGYWKSGALHSCSTTFRGNYAGAIGAFWRVALADLSGVRVLVDVGTGNGAIPLLARSSAQGAGVAPEIHGVDFAQIDPPSVLGAAQDFSGIRFHSGVSMDALPFAAGGVDMLTSQFAFEYGPREATLAEFDRVLGDRGRIAMVLHSQGSPVFSTGTEQLEQIAFLEAEGGFLDRAEAMAQVLAHLRGSGARGATAASEAVRGDYNASATALMARLATTRSSAEILARTAQRIQPILGGAARSDPADTRTALRAVRESVAGERRRLGELVSAALSAEEFGALVGSLRASGFDVDAAPLVQDGDELGFSVVARR